MIETIIFVSTIYCTNILINKSASNHCVDFKRINYKGKISWWPYLSPLCKHELATAERKTGNKICCEKNHFRCQFYFLRDEIHGVGEEQTKSINEPFEWIR